MKTSLVPHTSWVPPSVAQHNVQHDRAVINKQMPSRVANDPVARQMMQDLDSVSFLNAVNADLVQLGEQQMAERGS